MTELPVREPGPPQEVVDRARRTARGWSRLLTDPLRGKANALLPAHRVFSIGLRDLAERPDLESIAEPVGWQFLVRRRGEPMAIEVSDRGLDVQTETGPQVRCASELLDTEHDAIAPGPEATARLLRVPEMGLMAVWFLSLEGDDELIIPLEPSPQRFHPLERYRAPEFLEGAAEIARRRLDAYPEPGSGEEGGA